MCSLLTMTEKVGLVHQMPYACTRKGFASNAENVMLRWGLTKSVIFLRPKKCNVPDFS